MRQVFTAALCFFVSSVSALAGPKCDSGPQDKWLTEAQMTAKAVGMGYAISVFKKTDGNCYEIYGKDASGKRVEVYFHPVTGERVK